MSGLPNAQVCLESPHSRSSGFGYILDPENFTGTAAIQSSLEISSWRGMNGESFASRMEESESSLHWISNSEITLHNVYIQYLELTNVAWNSPSGRNPSAMSALPSGSSLLNEQDSLDSLHSGSSRVGNVLVPDNLNFFRFSRSTAALLFLHKRGIFECCTIAIPQLYDYYWHFLTARIHVAGLPVNWCYKFAQLN